MSMRDRVVELKEELEEIKRTSQENTLATEMLRELKATSKRKDIIIIILIAVIVAMVIAFFIHEGQYDTVTESDTSEQHIENIDNAENVTYTQQIN